jgi:hypothetical protein
VALVQCPECGRQVSDQAASCPGCGYPIGGVVYVRPVRRAWTGAGLEGEIAAMMLAAGFLLALEIPPPSYRGCLLEPVLYWPYF